MSTSLLDCVLQIRRLSFTRQFQGEPLLKQPTVAEHSYYVAVIAMFLADDLFKRVDPYSVAENRNEAQNLMAAMGKGFVLSVMRRALLHDVSECLIGDIPHSVKYNNGPKVKQLIHDLEDAVANSLLEEIYVPFAASRAKEGDGYDAAIVELADRFELMFTLRDEWIAGNRSGIFVKHVSYILDLIRHSKAFVDDECLGRQIFNFFERFHKEEMAYDRKS